MKKVAIIMGSDSDLPVVEKAFGVLDELGVPYETHVYSAHRTPMETRAFALRAAQNGFGVVIAAAGMAAHLAGAIAANTALPVIGIPVKSGSLGGVDRRSEERGVSCGTDPRRGGRGPCGADPPRARRGGGAGARKGQSAFGPDQPSINFEYDRRRNNHGKNRAAL